MKFFFKDIKSERVVDESDSASGYTPSSNPVNPLSFSCSNTTTPASTPTLIMTASRAQVSGSPTRPSAFDPPQGMGHPSFARSNTSPRTPTLGNARSAGVGHSASVPLMTSPKPDLSHLTEEERRIIEDVISRQQSEESKELEFLR